MEPSKAQPRSFPVSFMNCGAFSPDWRQALAIISVAFHSSWEESFILNISNRILVQAAEMAFDIRDALKHL